MKTFISAMNPQFANDYYTRRENITAAERQAAIDSFDKKKKESIYSEIGSTAFISVTGPLSRKGPDAIDRFFGYGGTSYLEIIDSIKAAEDNYAIDSIDINCDTPGGEVTGLDEVWQAIDDCKKNIRVINTGMIASAGYYFASAADKIVSTAPSNETGSIGVVVVAINVSEAYERKGIKIVQITSSNAPKKRPDIKTEDGIKVLQERVDALENIFISRVATGRKTTAEDVKKNYGQGSLFVAKNPDGPDALSAGMIDELITESFSDDNNKNTPFSGAMEETMSLKKFLAENPDAKKEFDKEMSENFELGVIAGKEEIQKRIDAAAEYIGNQNYAGIEPLAIGVLKGEKEIAALQGAVATFDMLAEKAKSDAAKVDSQDTSDVSAQQQEIDASQTGEMKKPGDFEAMQEKMKQDLNIGGAK